MGKDAPGVIIYNAVMGAPDKLMNSTVAHLQEAYTVDVIGAIVVVEVAAPVMKAGGVRHHHCHWRWIRRSSDPGPLDGLSRQSRSPVGRNDARGRFGTRRYTCGHAHDRRQISLPVLPLTRSILLSAIGTSSKLTAHGSRSFALPASSGSHEDARQARDCRRSVEPPLHSAEKSRRPSRRDDRGFS